ncbi:MAG: hypothetical protein ACKPKO_62860, partial [Candidatus Fonsibacter sp.]
MYGSQLQPALDNANHTIDTTLNRIATGINDNGRQQVALGLNAGGLGLRRMNDIAVPAELAAKLTARPKIKEICQALTTAGIMPESHLLDHLDNKIAELQQTLASQLDQTEATQLPDLVQQITKRA